MKTTKAERDRLRRGATELHAGMVEYKQLLRLLDDADRCAELEAKRIKGASVKWIQEDDGPWRCAACGKERGNIIEERIELKGYPDHFKRIAELEFALGLIRGQVTHVIDVMDRALDRAGSNYMMLPTAPIMRGWVASLLAAVGDGGGEGN